MNFSLKNLIFVSAMSVMIISCGKSDDIDDESSQLLNYSCVTGDCEVDENGNFTSLENCITACSGDLTLGFNCVEGDCQSSENGTYDTLAACQSQCEDNSAFIDPRDGEIYNVVIIGDQTWFADNLRYSGGIPPIEGDDNWAQHVVNNPGEPAWTYYADAPSLNPVFGKLYNGYFATNGSLCPNGWRVPNDTDWQMLFDFLGGTQIAGGKMKSLENWVGNNNVGATNSSGFTGQPGGSRWQFSFGITVGGTWWGSSNFNNDQLFAFSLNIHSAAVSTFSSGYGFGYSCRCIKE